MHLKQHATNIYLNIESISYIQTNAFTRVSNSQYETKGGWKIPKFPLRE